MYETTLGTLSSRGENFFTRLFLGELGSLKDSNGAVFIDRKLECTASNRNTIATSMYYGVLEVFTCFTLGDGDYFSPILHYLRTSRVDIPPSLSRAGVLAEAEFYLVEALAEAIKEEDQEQLEEPPTGKQLCMFVWLCLCCPI